MQPLSWPRLPASSWRSTSGVTLSWPYRRPCGYWPLQALRWPTDRSSSGHVTRCDRTMQDDTFEIYLAWSDRRLHVGPDGTALGALLEAGLPVETGCQMGG